MKIFNSIRKKRRASLQLSINAIVILVMAMVVLGLGLAFIRGLFGQGTDNLSKVLDNTRLENPATAQNPLTIDKTVKLKQGKYTRVHIGFYNTGTDAMTFTPTNGDLDTDGSADLECAGGEDSDSPAIFTLQSTGVYLNSGQATGFEAVLADQNDEKIDTGLYICTLHITDGDDNSVASGQFYVEVVG